MDRILEFQYICAFAAQSSFDVEVCRDQLRALWTAYCLHNGLDVDTLQYDNELLRLWYVVSNFEEDTGDWGGYDSFDGFMCEYLI